MSRQKVLRTLTTLTVFLLLSACVSITRPSPTDATASATGNESADSAGVIGNAFLQGLKTVYGSARKEMT
ncbi:MAG TPA: hypothetical protein P5121_33280 [Caldilineaceae bacterium]|nr:hypothetical protein [Caldilineaceae bacterium]